MTSFHAGRAGNQNITPTTTMNSKSIISSCAALLLATALSLNAGDPPKPKPGSPEFEKMKTLVGTWKGKTDMGQGPVDLEITYRVIAAGSVVEERCFPGTPNEMVTMYYDKEGKLSMTHYCIMGNRPEMALKKSEGNTLTFDLDACCNIDTKKESAMCGMSIRFDDPDTITTACKAVMDGKEMPEHPTTLKRVK